MWNTRTSACLCGNVDLKMTGYKNHYYIHGAYGSFSSKHKNKNKARREKSELFKIYWWALCRLIRWNAWHSFMVNWQLETIWPSVLCSTQCKSLLLLLLLVCCLVACFHIHMKYLCAAHQSIHIRFYFILYSRIDHCSRSMDGGIRWIWRLFFSLSDFSSLENVENTRVKCPQQIKGMRTLTVPHTNNVRKGATPLHVYTLAHTHTSKYIH